MPVGYLVGVLVVAVPALFALAPQRSVPNLINELPILGLYWLVFDTALAFAQGDIDTAGGWATVGLADVTTAGLAVIAWRGLRAGPVLERAMAEALGAAWHAAIDPGLAARPRRWPACCSCRCRGVAATSSGWPTSPTATPAAATCSTCTAAATIPRAARS
jgi:hypothetical protein